MLSFSLVCCWVAQLPAQNGMAGRERTQARFGGSKTESLKALARDSAGNLYLAGVTYSKDLPATLDLRRPAPASKVFRVRLGSYSPVILPGMAESWSGIVHGAAGRPGVIYVLANDDRSGAVGRCSHPPLIQFESHRVELPAIFELEHDETVLEYYDQVPAIKLDYCSADGKRLGILHTPDFFVIRDGSAGWEECKTEEELNRLAERSPNRYCRDGRRWTCPPGHQHADGFGLYYRIRSSAEINWLFQRNIQFFEDCLRPPRRCPPFKSSACWLTSRPGRDVRWRICSIPPKAR